ncbi:MAG: response regulator [Geobacteraceae bacterium]|nr:response regulator [Geobacteraceae bacterium]
MPTRKRLGEIFVEQGIISAKTVERILCRSKLLNQRFGTVLEDMELVTGEELAAALGIQYGFKTVSNLLNYAYPPEVLRIIPEEVCIEQILFPLRLEQSKLALAMADPTDTRIVNNIAENNGLTITPYIASRTEIFSAICKFYLGREYVPSGIDTVLVVDDDPITLDMITNILSKNGYRVITATNGMEGFKSVIAEKPQVVITDMVMPKLDGYGLLSALQNLPEMMFTPVILISAVAHEDEESSAFKKGFFDFMTKPVNEITLLIRVKRAFIFQKHHYRFEHEPDDHNRPADIHDQ